MKVLAEETVVRHHVEYDEEATVRLKLLGLLPPDATAPARLWSTQAEIDDARESGAFATILAKETVVRHHVEYDEEETALLKRVGFLPPYVGGRARLWWTQVEIDNLNELIAKARESRS